MYSSGNDNKMETWFQRARLMVQWASMVTAVRLFGPSP